MNYDLSAERAWSRDWLLEVALPLWWDKGADHAMGGWFDKLDRDTKPLDLPKRLRVQARQAFVYAEAGRLGWNGPWRDACWHGIDFMLTRFKRPDGLYRASVSREGVELVGAPDLYDQAFVLLALAAGYSRLGRPEELKQEAVALLRHLEKSLAHPMLGFEETNPRTLPLRSNPHMHMLEALLAWIEAGGGVEFETHARKIVDLACERLIDPATGSIGEFYDGNWAFHARDGHLREPGHQFEWAYLLHVAAGALGGDHLMRCRKLHRFGTLYGVREGRVIFSVGADGAAIDGSSRLWAQTERLRAMLVLGPKVLEEGREVPLAAITEGIATIKRFLDLEIPGLWAERVDASGNWLQEPTAASSLYHIVTGLVPLIEADDIVRSPLPMSKPLAAGSVC